MPLLVKTLPIIHFLIGFIMAALTLGFLLRIILTWYPKVDLNSGFWPIVSWPTEPFLKQTRKLISPMGGVDITPIVWVGLISLSRELLVGPQGLLTQVIFKISLLS